MSGANCVHSFAQRGHGWHAPFGAPLPSFVEGRNYFWRCRGGQDSGALERRENDFVCVGERDSPLPTARGEVKGAKRPRVRGPIRDSERSDWRNGVADFGREARPSGNAPSSRPPSRTRREGVRWRMTMLALLPDLALALPYRAAAIDIFALTPQRQSSRFASIHSAKCSSES
jgi:hypothetical protein